MTPEANIIKLPNISASVPQLKAALAAAGRDARAFGRAAIACVGSATAKRLRKGCDWIVANDVSGDVMGGENNAFHIVTKAGVDSWLESPKDVIARKLMEKVADELAKS